MSCGLSQDHEIGIKRKAIFSNSDVEEKKLCIKEEAEGNLYRGPQCTPYSSCDNSSSSFLRYRSLSFIYHNVIFREHLWQYFSKWGAVEFINNEGDLFVIRFSTQTERDAAFGNGVCYLGDDCVQYIRGDWLLHCHNERNSQIWNESSYSMPSSSVVRPFTPSHYFQDSFCAAFDDNVPFVHREVEVYPYVVSSCHVPPSIDFQSLKAHATMSHGRFHLEDHLHRRDVAILFPSGFEAHKFMSKCESIPHLSKFNFTMTGRIAVNIRYCTLRGFDLLSALERHLRMYIVDFEICDETVALVHFHSWRDANRALERRRISFAQLGDVFFFPVYRMSMQVYWSNWPLNEKKLSDRIHFNAAHSDTMSMTNIKSERSDDVEESYSKYITTSDKVVEMPEIAVKPSDSEIATTAVDMRLVTNDEVDGWFEVGDVTLNTALATREMTVSDMEIKELMDEMIAVLDNAVDEALKNEIIPSEAGMIKEASDRAVEELSGIEVPTLKSNLSAIATTEMDKNEELHDEIIEETNNTELSKEDIYASDACAEITKEEIVVSESDTGKVADELSVEEVNQIEVLNSPLVSAEMTTSSMDTNENMSNTVLDESKEAEMGIAESEGENNDYEERSVKHSEELQEEQMVMVTTKFSKEGVSTPEVDEKDEWNGQVEEKNEELSLETSAADKCEVPRDEVEELIEMEVGTMDDGIVVQEIATSIMDSNEEVNERVMDEGKNIEMLAPTKAAISEVDVPSDEVSEVMNDTLLLKDDMNASIIDMSLETNDEEEEWNKVVLAAGEIDVNVEEDTTDKLSEELYVDKDLAINIPATRENVDASVITYNEERTDKVMEKETEMSFLMSQSSQYSLSSVSSELSSEVKQGRVIRMAIPPPSLIIPRLSSFRSLASMCCEEVESSNEMCYLMINFVPLRIGVEREFIDSLKGLGVEKTPLLTHSHYGGYAHMKLWMNYEKALVLLEKSPIKVMGELFDVDIACSVYLKLKGRHSFEDIARAANELYGPVFYISQHSVDSPPIVLIFHRVQDARALLSVGRLMVNGVWYEVTECVKTHNNELAPLKKWIEKNEDKMSQLTTVQRMNNGEVKVNGMRDEKRGREEWRRYERRNEVRRDTRRWRTYSDCSINSMDSWSSRRSERSDRNEWTDEDCRSTLSSLDWERREVEERREYEMGLKREWDEMTEEEKDKCMEDAKKWREYVEGNRIEEEERNEEMRRNEREELTMALEKGCNWEEISDTVTREGSLSPTVYSDDESEWDRILKEMEKPIPE